MMEKQGIVREGTTPPEDNGKPLVKSAGTQAAIDKLADDCLPGRLIEGVSKRDLIIDKRRPLKS